MNKNHVRELIKESLLSVKMHDENIEELLMLTCAVESDMGQNIKQLNGGPAVGLFQMEPATHNDTMDRWLNLKRNESLKGLINYYLDWNCGALISYDTMRWNMKYAIIVARLKYKMIKEPIPKKEDVVGLAKYWKKYWNTELGDGTVEKAIEKYNKYVVGKV